MTTLDRATLGALLFEEEFSSAPPPGRWLQCYGWGGGKSSSYALDDGSVCSMEPANVTYAGGMAQMLAKIGGSKWGRAWSAPLLRTAQSFRPGCYIEGRMAFPAGQGFWGAFWLSGPDPSVETDPAKQFTGEIDIVEALMGDPTVQYMTAHWAKESRSIQHKIARLDLTQFVTYGLAWTAAGFDFYQNDILVAQIPWVAAMAGSLDQPMQILLNLSVGGDWGGPPANGLTQGLMQVDWVRVHALP